MIEYRPSLDKEVQQPGAIEDVMIIGEFNQWKADFMTKIDTDDGQVMFKYFTNVISGFKYRFKFIVNGEIVIDKS